MCSTLLWCLLSRCTADDVEQNFRFKDKSSRWSQTAIYKVELTFCAVNTSVTCSTATKITGIKCLNTLSAMRTWIWIAFIDVWKLHKKLVIDYSTRTPVLQLRGCSPDILEILRLLWWKNRSLILPQQLELPATFCIFPPNLRLSDSPGVGSSLLLFPALLVLQFVISRSN